MGLPLGLVAMLSQMLFMQSTLTTFDGVGHPLLCTILFVLTVLAWLRVPLPIVDWGLQVSANIYFLARLAFLLAAPDLHDRAALIGNGLPWLLLLLLLNDWLLNRKAAQVLNLTVLFVMALFVLAWWPGGDVEHQALSSMLVQMLLATTILLVVQAAMSRHAAALNRRAQQAIRDANIDALTGLPNRRALTAQLMEQTAQDGQTVAVALIDVDHFKSVNDQYGHARGDEVLRDVARALHGQLGARGLVGRYGGEEFLCLLDVPDEQAARQVCEQLRVRVSDLVLQGRHITVSVGLAVGHGPVHTLHLLESADTALYRAKAQGRNQVQVTVLLSPGSPPDSVSASEAETVRAAHTHSLA